ncbi:MAG: excinuclease ABC subunit C [Bacteroidetes bacterium]|nr:MAG: excinuclease ABC subunit C [Bacteroidota bacterium]
MSTDLPIHATITEKLRSLPENPGIYQFMDADGTIIYVGKAKNLKKRVSSYFNKAKAESGKTAMLVRKIRDMKYLIADTELEALLLENSLIKKLRPKYNVQLKDDKSFPWICIKNERFPRVFSTRQIRDDGSEYFGPYASVKMMNAILDLIKRLYKLRNCNYNLSEDNIEKKKFSICLEHHLGNCLGPCEGLQPEEDYVQTVFQIRDIIKGNLHSVTKHFKQIMKEHAENFEYEKAQLIKEKLEWMEKYRGKSVVVNPKVPDVDVFSIVTNDKYGYVNYMRVVEGAIVQGHTVELKKRLDESEKELLSIAILNLRSKFNSDCKEILVPFEIDLQMPYREEPPSFLVPKRGDKKLLLGLSERNAKFYMLDKQKSRLNLSDKKNRSNELLIKMKTELKLSQLPVHIECIDNSNIQGAYPVAALVVFKNTKPSKKDYRHFNIKTVVGANDFASMEEVVLRRYGRLKKENKPLPQLLIIDGGKGQISSAMKSLEKLKLAKQITVIGIAKRLEELYYAYDPVPLYLDKRSETLRIIQQLRNEAHRFGITHHRKKRIKASIKTELQNIKGVGESTAKILLKKYRSVKNIKNASERELTKMVGESKAKLIYEYLAKS